MTDTADTPSPYAIARYAGMAHYQNANMALGPPQPDERRVVFFGDSITEFWPLLQPEFFTQHGFIGRGIRSQVSHQLLLRFRQDVLALQPKVVVILAGVNDIAQNSGPVPLEQTAGNLFSMAELALSHGIQPVLCSVLPAIDFPWRRGLQPAESIQALNQLICHYASQHQLIYLDYYSQMADQDGGLKVPDYTSANDLVHPNKAGYQLMQQLVLPAIQQALAGAD